jgi:hypothetical protein
VGFPEALLQGLTFPTQERHLGQRHVPGGRGYRIPLRATTLATALAYRPVTAYRLSHFRPTALLGCGERHLPALGSARGGEGAVRDADAHRPLADAELARGLGDADDREYRSPAGYYRPV